MMLYAEKTWTGYTHVCAVCGRPAKYVSSFFEGPTFEACERCVNKGKLPAGVTEKTHGWFRWEASKPVQLSLRF
jgi:hypothetical protein